MCNGFKRPVWKQRRTIGSWLGLLTILGFAAAVVETPICEGMTATGWNLKGSLFFSCHPHNVMQLLLAARSCSHYRFL